jgi:thymidine kinase
MSLEIIMGSMFSGKSSEMIRRLKRFQVINKKILVINSSKDTRSDCNVIQTHDLQTFTCIKVDALSEVEIDGYDIIAVDEAQFFKNLRLFVEMALAEDKYILLAGLDGDFQQNVFGEMWTVMPLADTIVKLRALCMTCLDGTKGPFTKRITCESQQELIGDSDHYQAVCRKHL